MFLFISVEASLRLSDLMYHTKQKNGGYFYARQGLPHGDLLASLFVSCNVYEKEEIEIIRCPEIETDTIEIPGWDKYFES